MSDQELNIFMKSVKAVFAFAKFTMVDVLAKFVILMVTMLRDGFKWIIKIEKPSDTDAKK